MKFEHTIKTANEPAETGMAEEPIDAKMERLERQNAKVQVIDMILSYRNKASDEERLRQIKVVVE